jgi:hypothetical protein
MPAAIELRLTSDSGTVPRCRERSHAMAGGKTFKRDQKRRKEMARKLKQEEKMRKRLARKEEKKQGGEGEGEGEGEEEDFEIAEPDDL